MPSFIRLFAVTDHSPVGLAAHEYLKSLIRIAPVRVVSMSGGLVGPSWSRHVSLTMTPMVGDYVSCVCTHPSSWVSELSVPMPASEDMHGDDAGKIEGHARGTTELYTAGVRNVLFVVTPPQTDAQFQAARRYEAIVIPSPEAALAMYRRWPNFTLSSRLVQIPVFDHASVRNAITGVAS